MSSAQGKRWRIVDVLQWGERDFAGRGIEHPRREMEWLLTELLSIPRIELYLQFERLLDGEELGSLRAWVHRRRQGEPLQYITGRAEFYGLSLRVTREVLIPRPETERVAEAAITRAQALQAPRVLDVGTGSGCIAVALAANCPSARVTAIDCSRAALDVARSNAAAHGVSERIDFRPLDFLLDLPSGPFDLLVGNLPYVTADEMPGLMHEVRDWEPSAALTDGGDGLSFYRRIAATAGSVLRPGGAIIVEVGRGDHPERTTRLFREAGLADVQLLPDFNGDPRVAVATVP